MCRRSRKRHAAGALARDSTGKFPLWRLIVVEIGPLGRAGREMCAEIAPRVWPLPGTVATATHLPHSIQRSLDRASANIIRLSCPRQGRGAVLLYLRPNSLTQEATLMTNAFHMGRARAGSRTAATMCALGRLPRVGKRCLIIPPLLWLACLACNPLAPAVVSTAAPSSPAPGLA